MPKTSVHVSVEEELKDRVESRIKHSSMTYSDLAESAFKNFLSQYDEKVECGGCGARMHVNILERTDGKCPNCGDEV